MAQPKSKPADPGGHPAVTFTLDGIEYASADRKMPAAEVLRRFGSLDPATYDLIRLVGKDEEKRYADTDDVELVPHGRYISFFTGSMPVE